MIRARNGIRGIRDEVEKENHHGRVERAIGSTRVNSSVSKGREVWVEEIMFGNDKSEGLD